MHENELKNSQNSQEQIPLRKRQEADLVSETNPGQSAFEVAESINGLVISAAVRGTVGVESVCEYVGAEARDIEEAQLALDFSNEEIRAAERMFKENLSVFAGSRKNDPLIVDMKKGVKMPSVALERFELQTLLPGETAEEYLTRLDISLHEWSDSNNPQTATEVFLRKHSQSLRKVTKMFLEQDERNSLRLIEILKLALKNDDARQSHQKDLQMTKAISQKIEEANRDAAIGTVDERRNYYGKTNQGRSFFTDGIKDSHAYARTLFGLPEPVTETEAGKEYLHGILDNKIVYLLGGGDSINDLLQSNEYMPKNVINFDPYVASETIGKNESRRYQSLPISAADSRITEMVGRGEIPKADEIWASYSVPFYLTSPEEIMALVSNIFESLADGGNARISPIAVQGEGFLKSNESTFDEMRQAFQMALTDLMVRSDINVTIFGDSLKIHKIKVEVDERLAFSRGELGNKGANVVETVKRDPSGDTQPPL
jgi:hypothetical protein